MTDWLDFEKPLQRIKLPVLDRPNEAHRSVNPDPRHRGLLDSAATLALGTDLDKLCSEQTTDVQRHAAFGDITGIDAPKEFFKENATMSILHTNWLGNGISK